MLSIKHFTRSKVAVSALVTFLVSLVGFGCYQLGFIIGSAQLASAESNTITSIDYPLIDVSFTPENEWLVVVRTELFEDVESFLIAQNRGALHFNSDQLLVSTFPLGRGTTPTGIVYVYRDGALIKEVAFFEFFFENDTIRDAFYEATQAEIIEMIGSELPSPI
ncbi:MAG: hypothetical protein FWE41_04565 [Coriobacteriia bacterium]|nr:hypothetical protein [Coriobacteriia bacterium]